MVGSFITPPNVLEPAYPKLSSRITITFGAPAGALTWKIGGAFAFLASSSVIAGIGGSASGNTVRSSSPGVKGFELDVSWFGPPQAATTVNTNAASAPWNECIFTIDPFSLCVRISID